MKKFYFFIGTTAELIKIAPVMSEFEKRNIEYNVIASNQNTLRFEEVESIVKRKSADYTLRIPHINENLNIYLKFIVWLIKTTANYYLYFRREFKNFNKKNVYFIVHGDTISALLGSVVSKINGVKVVHVEAGLRSFNFFEPFPEELCRYIISSISDIHFSPNSWAIKNLKNKKGVKINTFSNTNYESVTNALKVLNITPKDKITKSKYFILVIHRQEHILFNKQITQNIINTFIHNINSNLKCVFIMHPLTKNYLVNVGMYEKILQNKNIVIVERLPYINFIDLLSKSEFIATDGGSNQEDAFYLGKPCLVLRKRTERIEGLKQNVVIGGNNIAKINKFINEYKKYKIKLPKYELLASTIIVDNLT